MKTCAVQGCNNSHRAKGFCGKHYKQWRKERLGETVSRDGSQGCKVAGCEGRHEAMGFCSKHYKRWRRGTLSTDGTALKKMLVCRVLNCHEERYMGGYCEQHFNRLTLMRDLWLNKVIPADSLQRTETAGESYFQDRGIDPEDIRADLDYDYTFEGSY